MIGHAALLRVTVGKVHTDCVVPHELDQGEHGLVPVVPGDHLEQVGPFIN